RRTRKSDAGYARTGRLNAINGVAKPNPLMRVVKGVVLLVACILVILPFVSVISTSLADQSQINAAGGYVLWPEDPSFAAYEAIFRGGVVTRATLVSIGITVVGSGLSLTVISLLAYALSRPGSLGHRPIML